MMRGRSGPGRDMRLSRDDGSLPLSRPVVQVGPSNPASSLAIGKERIIRLKTVLDRTGLSRSTLYRKIDDGTFPRQISISTRGAGWRESDINRWIDDPGGWVDADLIGAET